jgi:hypothetical protein
VNSQDRIAYELAGNDGTKFNRVKKMDLETIYKQLFITREIAERRKTMSSDQ